jgi:hypothetical protein
VDAHRAPSLVPLAVRLLECARMKWTVEREKNIFSLSNSVSEVLTVPRGRLGSTTGGGVRATRIVDLTNSYEVMIRSAPNRDDIVFDVGLLSWVRVECVVRRSENSASK